MSVVHKVARWLVPTRTFSIEVTRHCNLGCRYCYRNPDHHTDEAWMSIADLGVMLEKISRRFRRLSLSITGGEPLLHPDISTIVRMALAKDPGLILLSNLLLFSADTAHQLLDTGLRNIQFTFFSAIPAEHEHIRGFDDLKPTLQAIIRAKNLGFHLTAILLVTPHNLNSLIPTMTLLIEMGVQGFMINRYNAGFPGEIQRGFFLTLEQTRQLLETTNAFAKTWQLRIPFGIVFPPCVMDKPHDQYEYLDFAFCPLGRPQDEYNTIDYHGNLRGCNHLTTPIGNLLHQEWDDIIRGSFYRNLVETIATPPAFCADCPHWRECRGGCRAAALTWNGSLEDVDPWVLHVRNKRPQ